MRRIDSTDSYDSKSINYYLASSETYIKMFMNTIYIYIYIYISKKCNPPISLDRHVRMPLHFSYLVSHISYSQSHNILLSYLVSYIWGGFEGGGDFYLPNQFRLNPVLSSLCHTILYLLCYTILSILYYTILYYTILYHTILYLLYHTILMGFISYVRLHTQMPI